MAKCSEQCSTVRGCYPSNRREPLRITYTGGGANRGTIFQLTSAGKFATLYSFCAQLNCGDGGYPLAGLVEHTFGFLDGVASVVGLYGFDTAYNLWLGSQFVRTTPNFGKVGAAVTLTGPDFSDATSVNFYVVPSTFTVVGPYQISAAVPSGATTGAISVVTAIGTVERVVLFTVICTN